MSWDEPSLVFRCLTCRQPVVVLLLFVTSSSKSPKINHQNFDFRQLVLVCTSTKSSERRHFLKICRRVHPNVQQKTVETFISINSSFWVMNHKIVQS